MNLIGFESHVKTTNIYIRSNIRSKPNNNGRYRNMSYDIRCEGKRRKTKVENLSGKGRANSFCISCNVEQNIYDCVFAYSHTKKQINFTKFIINDDILVRYGYEETIKRN